MLFKKNMNFKTQFGIFVTCDIPEIKMSPVINEITVSVQYLKYYSYNTDRYKNIPNSLY